MRSTAETSLPTIGEAASQIADRTLSPVDLMNVVLRRLQETEDKVHAYATVRADEALAEAGQAEREIAAGGWRGPLHGIPVNLKDVLLTAGIRTEAGSKVLSGFIPSVDSAVAERLRANGAIIVGKSVTHEFAYGQNVVPTRNPWNLDCYSGGSSAGAGVSVAVGSALGAIGSDTGGSLRLPAAMNGVAAIKPTFGRVSKRGLFPLAASMDHCGPVARTVEDLAIILSAVSGFDPGDASSARRPVPDFGAGLRRGVAGVRIGIERAYYFASGAPEVLEAVETALSVLTKLGAEVVEVRVPELEHATVAAETIILSEASSAHQASLRRSPEQYDPRTRLRLEVGELILATDYLRAQKLRQQLRHAMKSAFGEHRLDALVGPTLGTLPILIDDLPARRPPSAKTLSLPWLPYTAPFNLTGQPALTVNCGTSGGLPIAMQVVGRPFDESTVLRIGHAYQEATDWHRQLPIDP
jgi:aspartyl-tRNA(Asn)/glutamyl-tRNA(Gln) amidotransferase subunit A